MEKHYICNNVNKRVMEQRIIISDHFKKSLAEAISECEHDQIFVLTDKTTKDTCWSLMKNHLSIKGARLITIPCSDCNKTLESLVHVWKELQLGNGSRHSLLINVGGGMVTDLGGFAASTFKRGINFINVPTTLLAMVDASVGGKTGINFGGLKNEIGVFNESRFVIVDTKWLQSLDTDNLLSGYAEMLKHGLIANDRLWTDLLAFDFDQPDLKKLSRMLSDSIEVKEEIVEKDPHEQNIRKALNLGHTFGHAFEAWALKRKPILHGYAVAYGLICELYLSVVKLGFPTDKMRQTIHFIKENYGSLNISCDDYDELIELMRHDKKNRDRSINFTFLKDVGKVKIDQAATVEEIKEALDFLREG